MQHFDSLKKFLLIVGNARSGTTLLGALLDSYPSVILSNETRASAQLWENLNREEIVNQLCTKAELDYQSKRPSEGYEFPMGGSPWHKSNVQIMGDKIFNPALLFLLGKHSLIPSLEEKLQLPLFFIHSIRNPFDVIATMHHKSGAPISNRIRWYFMHCEAAAGILERMTSSRFMHCYHEELLLDTGNTIGNLCRFLDIPINPEHIQQLKTYLFKEPKSTRNTVHWTNENIEAIHEGIHRFSFLSQYADARFFPK